MRDILNTINSINEVSLAPSEITKYEDRFKAFIDHVANGRPFYLDAAAAGMPKGTEIVLDPTEANRFAELYVAGKFMGAIKGKDTTGKLWPLSAFSKTAEFGGATAKPSDTAEALSKEAAGLKPAQIGITDQLINASNLGKVIVNNPTLQSTPHGQAVIECAKAIMANKTPTLSPEIMANKNILAAITDNAGEYLGVLALIHGQSSFPDEAAFNKWLGGTVGSLILNYPGAENNAIADSFATIINPTTQHQINISSKGSGGGAAPAMSGLIVPPHLKKKKQYQTAIDLIELTQNTNLPNPTTISQVFQAMNLINERIPSAIPEQFKPFLPWPQTVVDEVNASRLAKRGQRVDLPKYNSLIGGFESTGTDGGKLTYVTKKAVVDIVNSGAIPGFQAAILEILDYNFIQQYTRLASRKTGALVFNTQWPAKLNGKVTMESKSGAVSPTDGGFSFKLSSATNEQLEHAPIPVDNIKKYGRKFQR